ncbi:hypothetical protein AYL20_06950 [Acinetobacter venetianus]|nr:hypothetical protein AYL20_06950 [Acinetobacter venetianus]
MYLRENNKITRAKLMLTRQQEISTKNIKNSYLCLNYSTNYLFHCFYKMNNLVHQLVRLIITKNSDSFFLTSELHKSPLRNKGFQFKIFKKQNIEKFVIF